MKRYIDGVDGLRALAVLAVLAFHAFPAVAPGGYIGVDIFFVISGFIITKIYFDRLSANAVTLKHFYLRRVRRLAPVYLLVIAATTLAAYLILEPPLLNNFSSSLGAQPVYLQNFIFWSQGDYFASALTRPLLHTWSLAVEEQFYLAYGLAILIARRSPRIAFTIILLITIVSYGLGDALSVVSPKTNFFLLPARLWEFGVGFFVARMSVATPRRWISPVRLAGLLLIAISMLAYDETAHFPGPQSLLACFGCALVLWTFSADSNRSLFLGHPGMTYVGRISYALYLWHWPIIGLASTYSDGVLSPLEAGIALIASWLLAHLSHVYLEEPVRHGQRLRKNKRLLASVGAMGVVFLAVAAILFATHGATFRYSRPLAQLYRAEQVNVPYRCSYWKRITEYPSEMCSIATPLQRPIGAALVLGDSHAEQLGEMIGRAGTHHGVKVFLTTRNCTLDNYGSTRYCNWSVLDRIIEEANRKHIKYVIAIAYTKARISKKRLRKSLRKLMQGGISQVFLMQTVPHGKYFDPAQRISDIRNKRTLDRRYTLSDYFRDTKTQRDLYKSLSASNQKISVLDPGPLICPEGPCDFARQGKPLYFDSHHPSPTGAQVLRPLYDGVFERLSHSAGRMRANPVN